MLNRFLAISWKEFYTTYKDRNALLIMFAMPIVMSLLIGAVFGSSSNDVSLDPLPVGIINQDEGAPVPGGEPIRLGAIYEDVLLPGDNAPSGDQQAITDFVDARTLTDVEQARSAVDQGDLGAVLVIPPDFTQQALTGSATVHIRYDSARSIGPSVILSITRAITHRLDTALIAQRIAPGYLQQIGQELRAGPAQVSAAVSDVIEQSQQDSRALPIQVTSVDLEGETRTFDALQYFAPSMAILFMTFAMAAGGATILNEQRNWTLQRILTTPTPRWVFLGGKLAGTFLIGLGQMAVLIGTTSLIAALLGRTEPVWGSNILGIALIVFAVTFAATSLGLLIAAAAKSPSQADTYSTVVLFLLGMLGGSFIPITNLPDFLDWLPKITLNYWGIQGFFSLAAYDAPTGDILTNVLALGGLGLVFIVFSLWRFHRRLEF